MMIIGEGWRAYFWELFGTILDWQFDRARAAKGRRELPSFGTANQHVSTYTAGCLEANYTQ